MPAQEQLKKVPMEEELIAPFLLLIIGKITGWTQPTHIGGDPVYLTGDQTAALAAEGIRLLAPYLPTAAAQQVDAVVEPLPRAHRGTREERLMNIGRLGGVVPSTHSGDQPPGCCVDINGHLVCVR